MVIINKVERKKEDVKILKKEENNTKGITLIALVITIIVLLILAGVTISMLTGENGILTKASGAKTETVNKGALEKVQLAIAGSFDNTGKTDDALLKTNLGNVEGIEKPIPEITNKFTVVVDGVNIEITKDNNGYAKAELGTGTGEDKPVDKNTEYKDGEKIAIIPKGFKVSDVDGEKKIDTGLVVIGPDKSEFVWIPVDKNTLCVDGTAGKEIVEVVSGSDYRGQLYDFSGSGDATKSDKMSDDEDYWVFIEPLTVSYDEGYLTAMNTIIGTNFANRNDFEGYLQTEYNDIIKSIKQYGGYYVGRYESSITGSTDTIVSESGNIQSKKGVMPTPSSNYETKRWYGLYAKQKVYTNTLSGVDINLKSGMLYGSMYDGMLNFALKGTDKSKITESSIEHGPEKTGSLESDKINNVYDLGNNLYEWTAEALPTSNRVLRRRP